MAEEPKQANEQVVDLSGRTVGEASVTLVALATAAGYSIAATAPGSYRLARTHRKMLVVKHVESATITISENRDGTRARIVGSVDSAFIGRLAARTSPQVLRTHPVTDARATPSPAVQATTPASAPLREAPVTPIVQPARPSAPAPSPGGLITTPSWARQPEPLAPPSPQRVDASEKLVTRADDVDEELDKRTSARLAIRAERAAGPSIALPDGRTLPLTSAIVAGRSPDVARGPAGAAPLVIADPSLSKTHAVLEVDATGIWVTDLHSTNGTLLESGGSASPCEPGERTRLPEGAMVRLGDVVVALRGSEIDNS